MNQLEEMIIRPLYCDTNSFGHLSDKTMYSIFVRELEKSANKSAHNLLKALSSEKFIKHPVIFIELFGFKQKDIHQKLEKFMPSLYPDTKKAIAPFLKDFKRSNQSLEELKKLGRGLDAAIDVLYNGVFKYLWYQEADLSLQNLQTRIENQRRRQTDPSPLFMHYYEFIRDNLDDAFRNTLIRDLSQEALYRYGGDVMSKLYTGDHGLHRRWFDHLSAIIFWILGKQV